jgi:hypothetical protein
MRPDRSRAILTVLTYISRSLIDPHGPEMRALAAQCARNNRTLGVTGALYFDGRQFVQVIEGLGDAIDALWARLLADPRHNDLRILARAPLQSRRFPTWRMKMIDGTAFGPLGNHFAYDTLRSADADALERRLRLLERL